MIIRLAILLLVAVLLVLVKDGMVIMFTRRLWLSKFITLLL